jgi:hypothetical protein
MLALLWNIIFVEYFWYRGIFCFIYSLIRFTCLPDGVEASTFVVNSMTVIFFITLFKLISIYHATQKADKSAIGIFRILNIIFILATIILALISFVTLNQMTSSTVSSIWAQLDSLDQLYYNDNMENLYGYYKNSALFHGIYNIILAILFFIMTWLMHSFYTTLPDNWARPLKSTISFEKGKINYV